MFCTECGKKVEGNFCTNCGAKVENVEEVNTESGNIPIIVTRPKSMVGMAISFTVYVDGKDIGKLKNNTSLTCNVAVGEHTVIVKSLEKEVVQNVLIQDDTNSVELIVGIKMGLIAGRAVLKDVIYK